MSRWTAIGLVLITACSSSSATAPDAAEGIDAAPSSDASAEDLGSTEPPDAGELIPDAEPPPVERCEGTGVPETPFARTGTGTAFGGLAGDFTAATSSGTFTLSEAWTGCDSYVFLVHFPGITDGIFGSTLNPVDLLITEGPRNVHYFFLSDGADATARADFATAMQQRIEPRIETRLTTEEDRAHWRARIHYVTDRATEIQGSIGAHLAWYLAWARTPEASVDLGDRGVARAPLPVAFGIDRAQRFDPGDNLSPAVGRNASFGMAAFLGHFYEYRRALEARLESEPATVVTLLDERTTGRLFTRTATLPGPIVMAGFDTMELDIAITCEFGNPFACSEWDRIANVQLCTDGAPCMERMEIARWITPYWRRGRQHYLIDATPFLAFLRDGGPQTFFIELGPEWERPTEWMATVSIRLRTRGGEPLAIGGVPAFRGGAFDANYNMREPLRFTPPADAARVELVTILTGHGQTMADNCAEWCDHRHSFAVNGNMLPVIQHLGSMIGSPRGCAARANQGVIPGQWGNWAQSRAYWCPGLPVVARRDDITAQLTLGAENELTYAGSFGNGGEPRGGDIALSAYVIWYAASP